MTNIERNRTSIIEIHEQCKSFPVSSNGADATYRVMSIGLLEDISRSLASIADSLERLAPREHEDLN